MIPSRKYYFLLVLCIASSLSILASGLRAEETVKKLAGDFKFTEGPAANAVGDLFFTDIPNNRIHKLSSGEKLSVFREDTGGANGLMFDKNGNLLICEGKRQQLVLLAPDGKVTVLADKYKGKQLNSPNDLWIDPKGGVYFTDPRYGNRSNLPQDGEHVYYLSPDRKSLIRVVDDMVRPNGIIGTPDGKTLYVADNGGGKTYVYSINSDGTLKNKKLFANEGSDGMAIDKKGNVYLTNDAVQIFNSKGEKLKTIRIPERPSNVCFRGDDYSVLFVTARKSLYSAFVAAEAFEPTSDYTKKSMHGFTVLISKHLARRKEVYLEVLKELDCQLSNIVRDLPANSIVAIRDVKIWVEWENKKNGGAEFHPSAGWLRNNHYNPEKVDSAEISNARNFVKWSRTTQPCMVLHEMAHAYHHLVLGDKHQGVKDAYRRAVEGKTYEQVEHVDGRKQIAYALNNEKEYFAELTEAYFGRNDFYPFDSAELKVHDPVGCELIQAVWKTTNKNDKQ